MKRIILSALLAFTLAPSSAHARAPQTGRDTLPTSALLSFKDLPATGDGLRGLLDRIFQEAFKAKRWRLLERQRVDAILAERSFQEAAACSTSCASTIGSLLGVRTLLVPEFDRVDGVSHVSLRELDVATGEVLRLADVETDEALSSASRRIAHLLIGRLLEDPSVPASDSGFLAIVASPPTDVWVDGVPVGRSPLVVPVWPGTHRVATVANRTIPAPAKTKPAEPDLSATTIVIVHDDAPGSPRPRWHDHHHAPRGPRSEGPANYRAAPPTGPHGDAAREDRGNGDGAAIAAGAVAAVAGAALIAGAVSMPDSTWSEEWKDVAVRTADTADVHFQMVENDGKGTLGIIGAAILAIGVLVVAVVLQN